jgi:trans-aconitate methyltransferase
VFCVSLPFAANRVKHAELLQMDARQIPYKDEFDVIGAFDVLEHIEEDETVLSQMLQALLPGGGIAITVPQHMWLWSYQDEHACHVRRYSAKELRKKVINAGFKVEYETSFVCLLLPAMFISRIFQKRPSRQITHLSELRLPTLINCAFKGIMFIEHLLIRLGISLPLGGSLLMVATKI